MKRQDVVRLAAAAALCVVLDHGVAAAQVKVCVELDLRSWSDRREERPPAAAPAPAPEPAPVPEPVAPPAEGTPEPPGAITPPAPPEPPPPPFSVEDLDDGGWPAPPGQPRPMFDPLAYLMRLIEHHVTHFPGFEAVETGCDERLTVELYPLEQGWTVFARYSGHEREEKVDRVQTDEFDALARRTVVALLRDVSIDETLDRRSVLRADSEGELRHIQGGAGFQMSIGTAMQVGMLPTSNDGVLQNRVRFVAPLAFDFGIRNVYRAWALDAAAGFRAGTQRRASSRSAAGHADYSFAFAGHLHFLRYLRPDSVSSFYLGGGAGFAAIRYRMLGPDGSEGLWGGGMNVDLAFGQELLRASALRFFVELDLSLPAYLFQSESEDGAIEAYLASAIVRIGLIY